MHIITTQLIGCFTCMSGEGEITSYAAGMAILSADSFAIRVLGYLNL